MTPLLWAVMVLSVLLLAGVVVVEETRVHEAHRDEESWRKRTCRHGGTNFQAYPGDDAERSQLGRRP